MARPSLPTPAVSPEPAAGAPAAPALPAPALPAPALLAAPAALPALAAPAPALPAAVWRADQLGHATTPALASGFARLDAELPGAGWPQGTLTELIGREPGIGELRLLVPLLRQLTRERRVVILLAPPHIPYAPALAGFGLDLRHLLVVQAPHAADRLWAVEQTLRSAGFGALLAWLPQEKTRPEHLRRMQLAAQGTAGPVFLFRSLAAQFEPSPAPLRLLLLPKADQRLSVQILKRRGPVLAHPLILELPQPVAAIQLRPRPAEGELSAPRSLATIHARRDEPRPLALN